MKVIQVIPKFALAGAEIMCETLSVELMKLGVETVIVSLYDYHSPHYRQIGKARCENLLPEQKARI